MRKAANKETPKIRFFHQIKTEQRFIHGLGCSFAKENRKSSCQF